MLLVTGGAGYIGSHVVKELAFNGYEIVVLDNLSTGHRAAVEAVKRLLEERPEKGAIELLIGDVGDRLLLYRLFKEREIDGVVHLAAFSQVGESMLNPGEYFSNNTARAIPLLESMVKHGVKKLVFSSTAAVYGEPREIPLREEHPLMPTSVYGASKLMAEQILEWYQKIHGIQYISLRYFNAAGADDSGFIGEKHQPETHLIPLLLQKVLLGKGREFTLYGDDYHTPDGTCIRDYVHVSDLARAHLLAIKKLEAGAAAAVYNLGSARGYSIKEVINSVAKVTGREVAYHTGKRRPGDPAVLLAGTEKARRELGWEPRYSLEEIITSAWKWHLLDSKIAEK